MKTFIFLSVLLSSAICFGDIEGSFNEPIKPSPQQIQKKLDVIQATKESKAFQKLEDCFSKKDMKCLETSFHDEFIRGIMVAGEQKICSDRNDNDCLQYKKEEIQKAALQYVEVFIHTINSKKLEDLSVLSHVTGIKELEKTLPRSIEITINLKEKDSHVKMFNPSFVVKIKGDQFQFAHFSDGNGC